jgi:hypothetical protein
MGLSTVTGAGAGEGEGLGGSELSIAAISTPPGVAAVESESAASIATA